MRILITGASRGIGRDLATYLSNRHEVIGLARTAMDLGGNIKRLQMDVVSESRWSLGFDYIDAVICCAGSQPPIGPAMSRTRSEWWQGVTNNLYGTFNSIHGLFPYVKRHWSERGKFICFSGGGATKARPNLSAYACSKTAISRLVETLSYEWMQAKESIDINAIAPGAVNTAMTAEILRAPLEAAGSAEVEDAKKTQQQSHEQHVHTMNNLYALVDWLLATQVSGKLFAAQWDDWKTAHASGQTSKVDQFVLRRVVA